MVVSCMPLSQCRTLQILKGLAPSQLFVEATRKLLAPLESCSYPVWNPYEHRLAHGRLTVLCLGVLFGKGPESAIG